MTEQGQLFHPIALTLTVAMGLLLLRGRARGAVTAVVVVACLVPAAQRIVIAGIDFNMLRILMLFGWARLLMRGQIWPRPMLGLDYAYFSWILIGALVYSIREAEWAAVVNRLGYAFDAVSVYVLFRALVVRLDDLLDAVRIFAWVVMLLSSLMLVENLTGRNLFAFLGGVPEVTIVRDGRLRCQGAFPHAILAGTFAATLTPLFFARWLTAVRHRSYWLIAALSSLLAVILSASGGPILSMAAAILGWALWPIRAHLSAVRVVAAFVLVFLHIVREKPVWHLIGRISNLTGGTGYHRYRLIDAFVERFGEWWLIGTSSTASWFALNASDITNQYVLEGIRGGIWTLGAFVAVLWLAFRGLGQARLILRRTPGKDVAILERLAWGFGVMLWVHAVSFIGVSYFGQMRYIFYLDVALIGSFVPLVRSAARRRRAAVDTANGEESFGPPGNANGSDRRGRE